MFVYLNNDSLKKKIFFNKIYKRELVHLTFDENTPCHEVQDQELADAIVSVFPFYLQASKEKPSIAPKTEVKEEVKEEKPSSEILEPEIGSFDLESENQETIFDTSEGYTEENSEDGESKEHKRGRKRKN